MYIIISYCMPDDAYVVCKDDDSGDNAIFDTELDAQKYANEVCAWNYIVVGL